AQIALHVGAGEAHGEADPAAVREIGSRAVRNAVVVERDLACSVALVPPVVPADRLAGRQQPNQLFVLLLQPRDLAVGEDTKALHITEQLILLHMLGRQTIQRSGRGGHGWIYLSSDSPCNRTPAAPVPPRCLASPPIWH